MPNKVEKPRHGFASDALTLLVALPLVLVAGALVVLGASSVIRQGDEAQTSRLLAFKVDAAER